MGLRRGRRRGMRRRPRLHDYNRLATPSRHGSAAPSSLPSHRNTACSPESSPVPGAMLTASPGMEVSGRCGSPRWNQHRRFSTRPCHRIACAGQNLGLWVVARMAAAKPFRHVGTTAMRTPAAMAAAQGSVGFPCIQEALWSSRRTVHASLAACIRAVCIGASRGNLTLSKIACYTTGKS